MNRQDQTALNQPKPRNRGQGFLRFLRGLLIGLVVLAGAGAIYEALASQSDRQNHPPLGKMVNVGAYNLHLYCLGQGGPTVILISGASNMYAHWDLVQRGVSSFTRVCSYDRAGTGWSDYPPDSLTVEQHADDLHKLLIAAGEKPPYIVVGHSIGGIQARTYYRKYPSDARGLVLVDSSIEGQNQRLPRIIEESNATASTIFRVCEFLAPLGVVRLFGLGTTAANAWAGYSEEARTAMAATFNRTENCRGIRYETTTANTVLGSGQPTSLGSVPLMVLTRGLDDVETNPGSRLTEKQKEQFREVQKVWLKMQAELAASSTRSKQIIARKSGHFIQSTEPDLVISAIRELIANTR